MNPVNLKIDCKCNFEKCMPRIFKSSCCCCKSENGPSKKDIALEKKIRKAVIKALEEAKNDETKV
jgi:hypothetical protein